MDDLRKWIYKDSTYKIATKIANTLVVIGTVLSVVALIILCI